MIVQYARGMKKIDSIKKKIEIKKKEEYLRNWHIISLLLVAFYFKNNENEIFFVALITNYQNENLFKYWTYDSQFYKYIYFLFMCRR